MGRTTQIAGGGKRLKGALVVIGKGPEQHRSLVSIALLRLLHDFLDGRLVLHLLEELPLLHYLSETLGSRLSQTTASHHTRVNAHTTGRREGSR